MRNFAKSLWGAGLVGAFAVVSFSASAAGGEVVFDSGETKTFEAGRNKGWKVKLDPEWAVLTVKTRIKPTDVVVGKESWMNARVPMSFHDANGKQVGGWPRVFGFEGTHDWIDCERDFAIPDGAVVLNISQGNYGQSGTAEFAPIVVSLKRRHAKGMCNAPLPEGAPADPWELGDAWRQTTATRARWCLNGLWGWRPPLDSDKPGVVPGAEDNWGWGKVPSVWAKNGEWRREGQLVYLSPWLEDKDMKCEVGDRAWYRRDFVMPKEAAGKRVVLTFSMLQTHAVVYVDGKRAAEVSFPGGEADITDFVKPGEKQSVVLDVTAYPLNPETLDFNAPDRAVATKAEVKFRGITGDVYLDVLPKKARVVAATVECDVADGKATFVAECDGVSGEATLEARVYDTADIAKTASLKPVATFSGKGLKPDADGRVAFAADWRGAKKWDVHTPQNRYVCALELKDPGGRTLDAALPFAFGFRDVRIKGRDLLLNGTPIHLRALVNRTMNADAGVACRESAIEACRRLKELGVNFVIADNYNFSPGAVSYMDAILDVCDETGMLFSFSLPHARDFDMKLEDPAVAARYRELARWCIRRARNHPSVITYAMNHNLTGYVGDMDPLRIDGKYELTPDEGDGRAMSAIRRRHGAHLAWEIAKSLDPTRPVYHHESGNLDEFHTVNIYLNWAPAQERSDWLTHWSAEGVKPLFFVEWGMPHITSWSSYRGPLFIWRKPGYQSLWANEYAAALLGDAAYPGDDPVAVKALAKEEDLWKRQRPFKWYELNGPLREMDLLYAGVQSIYMSDNWRCHRAWGITAMLPWDQSNLFKGGQTPMRVNPNRWEGLKSPGIVPDEIRDEGWDTGTGDAANYTRTSIGETLARWNADDCAFIGGKGVFTDKAHHFRPGETVEKTLVILNDRRVELEVEWTCELKDGDKHFGETLRGKISVPAGGRRDVPVSIPLPDKAGRYTIVANFAFAGGAAQKDVFGVEAYAPAKADDKSRTPFLYDPKGLTAKEFDRLGVKCARLGLDELKAKASDAALAPETPFVVGRECLTRELLYGVLVPAAHQSRARVLVFEQTKDTLESVGFRAQTYGLRTAFPRFRDGSLGLGLDADMLRDWNGESTLVTPYIEGIPKNEQSYLTDTWAGYVNTRVWRCGNRGNVATAIPEKPTVGDWRALADGGFDLQYAPLLDWTVGDGRITFCQLDVTARTASDPVADDIVRRLVSRLGDGVRIKSKSPRAFGRTAWIAMRDLAKGLRQDEDEKDSGAGSVYVVSSGAEKPKDFLDRIAKGGQALCLGFTAKEVAEWSPVPFEMAPTNGCVAARIGRPSAILNGLSNADWSWHGAMDFDAFTSPAEDGNAAFRTVAHGKGRIVFWQVPPWAVDDAVKPYLRTTKRRAQYMLCRILANMGVNFAADVVRYADVPVPEDDPYRYYRW